MPIRITGLNSGLDTEAIISALVSSYNYKTEKYKKAQTKLSWKQEAWQTLNTKIYSFYNNVGKLRYSSAYNLKSTTVSDSTKATVTAGSNAPNGTQRLNITQIAQAGYLTGGKLASGTTTGTTLAELGYTGGDGKITVTKGDGTTKEISVSQGTTVSSFITSLKNAGLTASYDTTNKRIYVSSKDTGAANDFTLTGANVDGANALYALGLNVESSATSATYESYTKYYDTSAGGTIESNVEDGVKAYKAALAAYEKASAQNANLAASYGYASAYSAMMDTLSKVTDGADRQKLRTLLEMTASQRVNSVMDTDGKVYTKTGTDEDGNTIYSYGEGESKQYIKSVVTVTYTGSDNKTYTLNEDKTYKDADGKIWEASDKKDENGNTIYTHEENGTVEKITISGKSETSYYSVDPKTEDTTTYTVGDATYTSNADGTYTGSDGKIYELNKDDKLLACMADGSTVDLKDVEPKTTTKTVYENDKAVSGMKRSSDVLTDIKSNYSLTDDDEIKTLTSNISTVNTFEKTADTLDDTDPYSRAGIAAAMKSVYETGSYTYKDAEGNSVTVDCKDDKGNLITGAAAVNKLANTYAGVITANKTTMETSQATMDEHSALAKIAAMEDGSTEQSNAITAFVTQVQEAHEITEAKNYNTDAKKIDGQDAIIKLNGVEYTNTTNAFSINGLSIIAQAETGDDEDDAITITTQTDVQGIYDKIKDFLTQYNALINEITSLYNADSAKGYEPLTDEEKDSLSDTEIEKWEEKIKSALLRRDDSLEGVMNSMTSAMSKGIKVDGKMYYLSSFGINTLGYLNAAENEQYAYHINGDEDDSATSGNTDKLMAAITNNPDTVIKFMKELCTSVYDAVGDKMKSTTLSSVYKVYNDKEMASEYSDYTDLIKKWEEKLEEKEDYWYNKFSSMETALSKLNSQSSSLSSLLGG